MKTVNFPRIFRSNLETLQVNLGYKCNQACSHCHVDASPLRVEMMDDETISLIPKALDMYELKTLDITGGAPEMHPRFKELIKVTSTQNIEIIDRCNLTILKEPGYEDLIDFLALNRVRIVASLPCYIKENVDMQRGKGVFLKSIEALRSLNQVGYGKKDSNLIIDLVYNPIGPNLPPSEEQLEKDYHKYLLENYGISFNKLLVLANMPINRFSEYLRKTDDLDKYYQLLTNNYNKANLKHVMCINTLSIDWQGNLYDCDFNQQLKINDFFQPKTLKELVTKKFKVNNQEITVRNHCFGCTAGNGSSCGGSLT